MKPREMTGKFKFNKNNVCTNPNVIRREDGQCSFEIDTAIGRYERWVYGCSCNLISTGFGSPCMDKAQHPLPSYPTEEDAIKAACKEIRKFLAKNTTGSDPNSNFGKGSKSIPLICIETGERFPSFKDCSEKLGIPSSQISSAIKRHGTVHGYTLKKEVQNG